MKVTANIATYAPRKESLKRMIQSIENQVDSINIYDNEIQPVNLTDNGKFFRLDLITKPEYYLCMDDDLIYPPDYVKRMIEAIERYQCIISYHGRQLLGKGLKYYSDHKIFHCIHGIKHDEIVDVIGTGVTGFDTRYFHPKGLANSPDKKMSDLIFSLEAAKQSKQMGVMSHEPNWIKMINNRETIYDSESIKGTPRQNQIANEIFDLRYGKD